MMNGCISFGDLYPIFRTLLHINGPIETKPFLRASVRLNQTLNRKYHDQPAHFCCQTIKMSWLVRIFVMFSDTFVPVFRPPVKGGELKNMFLISQPNHMLWVFKRTVSLRRFFLSTTNTCMFKLMGKKMIIILCSKNFLIWIYVISFQNYPYQGGSWSGYTQFYS